MDGPTQHSAPLPTFARIFKFVSKTESILLSLKDIDDPADCISVAALLRINLPRVTPPSLHSAGAFRNICVHSGLNYPRGLCRHTRNPSGAVAAPEVLLDPKPLFQFDTEALG